jgi:hypothetical protein
MIAATATVTGTVIESETRAGIGTGNVKRNVIVTVIGTVIGIETGIRIGAGIVIESGTAIGTGTETKIGKETKRTGALGSHHLGSPAANSVFDICVALNGRPHQCHVFAQIEKKCRLDVREHGYMSAWRFNGGPVVRVFFGPVVLFFILRSFFTFLFLVL